MKVRMNSGRVALGAIALMIAWAAPPTFDTSAMARESVDHSLRAVSREAPSGSGIFDGRIRSHERGEEPPTICPMDECPDFTEEPVICLMKEWKRGKKYEEGANSCERRPLRIYPMGPAPSLDPIDPRSEPSGRP